MLLLTCLHPHIFKKHGKLTGGHGSMVGWYLKKHIFIDMCNYPVVGVGNCLLPSLWNYFLTIAKHIFHPPRCSKHHGYDKRQYPPCCVRKSEKHTLVHCTTWAKTCFKHHSLTESNAGNFSPPDPLFITSMGTRKAWMPWYPSRFKPRFHFVDFLGANGTKHPLQTPADFGWLPDRSRGWYCVLSLFAQCGSTERNDHLPCSKQIILYHMM